MTEISIRDFIGKNAAVSGADAEKLYQFIKSQDEGRLPLIISTKGLSLIVTAFMNASFGRIMIENPDYERIFILSDLTAVQSDMFEQVRELANNKRLELRGEISEDDL